MAVAVDDRGDGGATLAPLPLGEARSDVIARTLGVAVGLIPVLGPMLQIAINETIPNIRLERIEAYLTRLSDQIEDIRLSAALRSPEGLDLFEEGMWQAARALGGERLGNIAALVAIGLKSEDIHQATARHFLRILNQIDDRQIVLLAKLHPQNMPTFRDGLGINYDANSAGAVRPQATAEDITDMNGADAAANLQLNASMLGHLEALGLLESGGMMDDVGAPLTMRRFTLSPFGNALLEHIGVITS